MKIIHNFLDDTAFKEIQKIHFSNSFPWYLQNGVNHPGDGHNQFIHTFYKNEKISSDHFYILKPLIDKLKIKKLIRIKSNLLCKTKKIIEHGFHTDFNVKGIKTAILYLNTNNGHTIFKNKKIIESEENKIVIFDCRLNHSGTTCTNSNFRALININYT
jgi:hypothetical protein